MSLRQILRTFEMSFSRKENQPRSSEAEMVAEFWQITALSESPEVSQWPEDSQVSSGSWEAWVSQGPTVQGLKSKQATHSFHVLVSMAKDHQGGGHMTVNCSAPHTTVARALTPSDLHTTMEGSKPNWQELNAFSLPWGEINRNCCRRLQLYFLWFYFVLLTFLP